MRKSGWLIRKERHFERVAITILVQTAAESSSASSGLHGVSIKRCVAHREVVSIRAQQLREDGLAFVAIRVFVNVAVHESVHHSRMSVYIDKKVQIYVLSILI
jgi:hypothetical protein